MKRRVLVLVICLPLASVVFGGIMFYFALTTADEDVFEQTVPLSKTSWRTTVDSGRQ